MNCQNLWEGIVTLAEGDSSPEAEAHVLTCESCAGKLKDLRLLISAAKLPFTNAPDDLISRARALMPQRMRRVARLLGNSLMMSGARSVTTDTFALRVVSEGIEIPLDFSRTKDGWTILGRGPSEEWSIRQGDEITPCIPRGRFSLTAKSLEESGFQMSGTGIEIDVPSAAELLELGT